MTGWLPAAAELGAYEGIRRGDQAAFRALAEPLQPVLRRLAGVYVDSEPSADALVLRSWDTALRGLSMFRWHTPLATWVAGITVAFGRTHHAADAQLPQAPATMPAVEVPGPPDWSDLPWGHRWQVVPANLAETLAALPLDQREVIHGSDVEQWRPDRVCAVFGLPGSTYERLLDQAHAHLRDTFASLIGQSGPSRHHADQIASIIAWLNRKADDHPERLDPRAVEAYRRWWAGHQTVWRRLGQPLRQLSG